MQEKFADTKEIIRSRYSTDR